MSGRQFQFEWDEVKAANNVRKHGVPFELARTIFHDKNLLSVADVEHSEAEERWFSVGCASSGALISLVTFGRTRVPRSLGFGSFRREKRRWRKSGIIRKVHEQPAD